MDSSKRSFFFVLLPLLISQSIVVAKPQVPCFFIFGDSLLDNGNNNNREPFLRVNYSPYGIDFPEGPTGRFSNARNLVDVLAKLLGFDKYIPPFANLTNHDILKGVNYAAGGSGIIESESNQPGGIITFNDQLSAHEVIASQIAELLGSESAAREYLSTCIYFVEMGSNDYLGNYFPQLYSSSTPYSPQQYAELVLAQYSKQLRRLYDDGARKIAVNELHKLASLPQMLDNYGSPEIGNNATRVFNENLKFLLNSLNNQLPGAKFWYTIDRTDASFGYFKNTRNACCQTNGGSCIEGSVPCNNRHEYVFWDGFHPTDAASVVFGKIAYNSMFPLYVDSIDIW